MRNDIFGYDIAIDRSLFNNQLSLSGSFAKEKDNLIKLKRLTTDFTTYSISMGANFSNAPSFQVMYTPSVQKDEQSETRLLNLSINSSYSFNTGKLSQSPELSFYYQSRQSTQYKSATTQISLGHSVDFNSPFSVSVNTSFDNSVSDNISSNSVTIDLSPSYTLFGRWRNNLSLGGIFEPGDNRFDIRYNSSFPIRKIADGNFSLTRSYYNSSEDDSYKSWSLSASLSKDW
jgi:hypothetical protein